MIACLTAGLTHAERVTAQFRGLSVQANLEILTESQDSIALILHGTWAHFGMEIISTLQASLAERGISSLAPNLSLGVDNRSGFLQCAPEMYANHAHAVDEIAHWVQYLVDDGWSDIRLLGHSRGGAQVALYQKERAHQAIKQVTLLAPMVFNPASVKRTYAAQVGAELEQRMASVAAARTELIGPLRLLNCENVRTPPASFLSYYAQVPTKHTPDIIQGISTPVAVFLGSQDQVAVWDADEISAAKLQKNVRLHVIEGAGHFFRDLYLDDVLDLLLGEGA